MDELTAPAVELSLVGSVLLDATVVAACRPIVRHEDFRHPTTAQVWRVIERLYDLQDGIDAVTIQAYLSGVEGITDFLISCADAVPTARHAESYAEAIRKAADGRRLGVTLGELRESTKDPQIDNHTAEAVDRLLELEADAYARDKTPTFGKALTEAMAAYDLPSQNLPLGVDGIDWLMKGTPPGSVIVMAGRPGTGKTTLAMTIAVQSASMGIHVEVIPLEMSRSQLMVTAICAAAEINTEKWRERQVSDFEFGRAFEACERLRNIPLRVRDIDSLSTRQLRSIAQRSAVKGTHLMIIDYLQLVDGDPRQTRFDQIATLTRMLKNTARRIARRGSNFRFLVLSQMNRDIEKGKKRKPLLSDLRENGSIEQDADAVIFLHLGEGDANPEATDVEVIVAKHRYGRTGSVLQSWNKTTGSYRDMSGYRRPAAAQNH